MFIAESSGFSRFASIPAISRRSKIVLGLVAMLHLAALGLMLATEVDLVAKLIFLLFWALLNFSWLTMFRRPSVAAILSLELVAALIILSQFKHRPKSDNVYRPRAPAPSMPAHPGHIRIIFARFLRED